MPATPTGDYTLPGTPSDRSLASTNLNLPISGRNTGMSYDGGDVFTMVIKQDSRDSNCYDAPSFIPDIQVTHQHIICFIQPCEPAYLWVL